MLTKSRKVLEVVPESSDEEAVSYGQFDDDSGDCIFAVVIPVDLVAELGNPHEITVTVEPGDKLNDTIILDLDLDGLGDN